jgi:hypothetical protein
MRSQTVRHRVAVFATSFAILAVAVMFARPAAAGCVDLKATKPASWQAPAEYFGSLRFLKVSAEDASTTAGSESTWGWDEEPVRKAPIVGLWAFKYISKGNLKTLGIPDGAILDGGNTLWYADGNENTVSGVRAPETGDVCLGIWKRTGEWTYELNHIGLSWNTAQNVPGGPAFIKQYVTLGRDKNTYTGTVTIRQLDPDGKTLSTPAPIKGTIVATRVTLDTDTQESLP